MERCEQCGEKGQDVKIRGNDPRRCCIPCGVASLDHRASATPEKPADAPGGLKWDAPVGDPHDVDPW